MIERTLIQDQWLVIQPDRKKPVVESSAETDQHAQELNAFLSHAGVGPAFRAEEMRRTPENQLVLHSPEKVIALQITTPDGKIVTRHCPQQYVDMLDDVQHEKVRAVQKIGNGLAVVSFPMDLGAPKIGKEPQQLLMSMIMEETGKEQSPYILVGRGTEFDELEKNAPKFEPIKLSSEQFNFINTQLDLFGQQFSGEFIKLPEKMIGENSNVKEISFYQESGKYFLTMVFTMQDGSQRTRVINNSQRVEDELLEGDNYCIIVDALGEKYVIVVDRERVNGEHPDFVGQKVGLPRGFSVLPIQGKEFNYRIGTSQTGMSGNTLLQHKVNGSETLVQDTRYEDVQTRLNIVELPPDVSFDLKAKQEAEPLAPVEKLVPTLLKMRDAVQALTDGTLFNDAHTIAMLAIWLFRNKIVELQPTLRDGTPMSELKIAMELTQDYRTGGERMTIWRGKFDPEQALNGVVSSNSGITRMWNPTGLADGEKATTELSAARKPWKTVRLVDLFEDITQNRSGLDIMAISAIAKLIFENHLGLVHTDKLITNPDQLPIAVSA
jgi:hypothetical protein